MTAETGLTREEAEKRLKLYGPNELAKKQKKLLLLTLLAKFLNPLILILLGCSIVAAFLGETTNFWIIQIMVGIGVLLDFFQEYHAQQAVAKLRQKVSFTATVLRDGVKQDLPVQKLVPGDIIFLAIGNIVPADAVLLESNDLEVNEAVLTGEPYPQEKQVNNSVFMGTTITGGEAKAIIVKTGRQTKFGQISAELAEKPPVTEFEQGAKKFGYFLMKIVLILASVAFLANAAFKHNLIDSLLFALALAVGITPELLPMLVTINLSRGALRMAKKKVIVKKLEAIQNLGGMEILCTDKTGTLTEGSVKLVKYEDFTGQPEELILTYGYLNCAYQIGLKSTIIQAMIKDYKDKLAVASYQSFKEIPFDFQRKRLSVIVKRQNKYLLITTGAPEGIFPLCLTYEVKGKRQKFSKVSRKKINQQFQALSAQGFRVVAVCYKEIEKKSSYQVNDEANLTFLGLLSFFDPPKKTSAETLQLLNNQGVELKILTGDNEAVTQKVCAEIGFPIEKVILGKDLAKMTKPELIAKAQETTIFARLDPEQKKQVIKTLKEGGKVVGYLGDGINDAPSLKEADVGISVNNAVDVAKEAADFILLHKDLHVLAQGVTEGRKTYANIMKYILMEISSNFGNMFSAAAASFFLPFLPMLPVQILLNNLLYEVSQFSIPGDKVDPEYLAKPKKWNINFIRHFMLAFGPISSLFDLLTYGLLLFIFKAPEHLFQTVWFLESFTTQTLIIFSIRTKTVPFFKSRPSLLLTIVTCLAVGFAWLIPFTTFGRLFSFTPPPLYFYLIISLMVIVYFFLVEKAKKWFYRRYEV